MSWIPTIMSYFLLNSSISFTNSGSGFVPNNMSTVSFRALNPVNRINMETVVSGIRPTGNLHLGNYFGAVKGFLQMQHEYNCLFFIADWHSLTTHPHPENIQNSVKTILSEYLACGIDPDVATIYVQSSGGVFPLFKYPRRYRRADAHHFFQG